MIASARAPELLSLEQLAEQLEEHYRATCAQLEEQPAGGRRHERSLLNKRAHNLRQAAAHARRVAALAGEDQEPRLLPSVNDGDPIGVCANCDALTPEPSGICVDCYRLAASFEAACRAPDVEGAEIEANVRGPLATLAQHAVWKGHGRELFLAEAEAAFDRAADAEGQG